MTPESQKQAARKHQEKQKLQGNRPVGVMLSGKLHDYLEHKRSVTPGGFNLSEFVRKTLTDMAIADGYSLGE